VVEGFSEAGTVMSAAPDTKVCTKCKTVRLLSEFSKCTKAKDGLNTQCRSCLKARYLENREKILADKKEYYDNTRELILEKTKTRRENNPEKVAESCRRWNKNHPEKARAGKTAWKVANPEKVLKGRRAYYESHKEQIAEYAKAQRKANPGEFNARAAARRATKKQAIPLWFDSEKEAIIALYEAARARSTLEGIPYHVDHIVPLKAGPVRGLHCLANLQIITGRENQSKNNLYWPGQDWIIHCVDNPSQP
jgi:hypothetical protein